MAVMVATPGGRLVKKRSMRGTRFLVTHGYYVAFGHHVLHKQAHLQTVHQRLVCFRCSHRVSGQSMFGKRYEDIGEPGAVQAECLVELHVAGTQVQTRGMDAQQFPRQICP